MIETVSVGMGHTIAKSKLGYVYVWGDNRFGQIHPEPTNYITTPLQLELEKQKTKALQAVAGLRTSYILLDNFQIISIGTSSSFDSVKNCGYSAIDLIMVAIYHNIEYKYDPHQAKLFMESSDISSLRELPLKE